MSKNYAPKPDNDVRKNARGHSVEVNNIETYYEDHGSGEPIILLHGFGGCSQNWLPFTSELSKHYRLIIADLRGHGYSTNPDNKFTHKEAANDVLLLLEKLGIDKFSAMGMSSGGMVLLHMVTQQPERFRALVLVSTPSHFPEQARAIMRRASFETMPPEVREMYRECAKRGDEQVRELISQFNAFHDNYDDVNFSAEQLSAVTCRTLIVHGDRDNFFPVDIAVNMYKAMVNSALWIIPNGDHVPIYDPGIPFTSTALRFLNGSHINKK